MSQQHGVRLPHPTSNGMTTGRCDCGWTVDYYWGGLGQAAEVASKHIEDAALAVPVEVQEFGGARMVLPGLSL